MIRIQNVINVDAARRMGKTTLMKKMAQEPPKDMVAYWIDLQHLASGESFFDTVYENTVSLDDNYNWLYRPRTAVKRSLSFLSGVKGFGFTLPEIKTLEWKALFIRHLKHMQWKHRKKEKVVFFFDEMPLLLHKILRERSPHEALEILSAIRSLADDNRDSLVFVLAGSLGLHHVERLIKQETSVNAPTTNTYEPFRVPPLLAEDAKLAAVKYLETFSVGDFDEDAAAEIAVQSNGIPYYIRSISLSCSGIEEKLTKARVKDIVNTKIRATTDALHIDEDHFQRLSTADYYDESKYNAIYELMSMLSRKTGGMSLADAFTTLNTNLEDANNDKLSQSEFDGLVKGLTADHLLERDAAIIRFKYDIVRRSWNFHNAGGA